MGRQRPSLDANYEDVVIDSFGDGTYQSIFIDLPANGRFDITVKAISEISDVNIVANWVYSDFLEPNVEEPIVEPKADDSCRDVAEQIMKITDSNSDGLIDPDEFANSKSDYDVESYDYSVMDRNSDGDIEFTELLQETCNCESELWIVFDQLSNENEPVSIELLSSQIYENKYNFLGMDTNSDQRISETEIEVMALICETTFDAFDGDGDGVPDDEDDFPNDPDESKDSDGDGVGDNADIAPSVANDLVYSIGAMVFIGLLALLVVFARGNRNNLNSNDWENDKNFDITETMLGMQEPETTLHSNLIDDTNATVYQSSFESVEEPKVNIQPASQEISMPSNVNQKIEMSAFEDLLNSEVNIQAPSQQIMGMIGMDGKESIEYPINSGVKWTRNNPSEDWKRS